ncbi:MAG: hypothetical protein CMD19_05960 [Flavobacteriales bacterium]|nr:hypothetical protein [Flavobacteriales bacterium]
MKNSFFSKILVVTFLFGGLSANAQVRVKTNTSNNNKKVVVKKDRSNYYNNRSRVRVKNNRNRVVVNKPNRPHRVIKRPTFNRPGYIWIEGYWKWNAFFGRYTWQKARWMKIKRNHYWVPGFWEITPGGFFWVKGYWQLEY